MLLEDGQPRAGAAADVHDAPGPHQAQDERDDGARRAQRGVAVMAVELVRVEWLAVVDHAITRTRGGLRQPGPPALSVPPLARLRPSRRWAREHPARSSPPPRTEAAPCASRNTPRRWPAPSGNGTRNGH